MPYSTRKLSMCLRCLEYERKPSFQCDLFLNKQIKRYIIKRKRLSSAMTYDQMQQLRDLLNTFLENKEE